MKTSFQEQTQNFQRFPISLSCLLSSSEVHWPFHWWNQPNLTTAPYLWHFNSLCLLILWLSIQLVSTYLPVVKISEKIFVWAHNSVSFRQCFFLSFFFFFAFGLCQGSRPLKYSVTESFTSWLRWKWEREQGPMIQMSPLIPTSQRPSVSLVSSSWQFYSFPKKWTSSLQHIGLFGRHLFKW